MAADTPVIALTALAAVDTVEPRGTDKVTVDAVPAGSARTGAGDVVASRVVRTSTDLSTADAVSTRRTFCNHGSVLQSLLNVRQNMFLAFLRNPPLDFYRMER